jgi:hypothetical protein
MVLICLGNEFHNENPRTIASGFSSRATDGGIILRGE